MKTQWLVVYDPRRAAPEGSVLEGDEQDKARGALERRGVVLLPVDAALLDLSALSGWFKRSFGQGVELSGMRGTRCCPLVLHVEPDREFVHLAVRLTPQPLKAGESSTARGQVRLVSDPSGATTGVSGGLSALELPGRTPFNDDLGPPDAAGGWTLRRAYRLSCSMRGAMMMQLYGVAQGVRVAWAAVSQARVGQV